MFFTSQRISRLTKFLPYLFLFVISAVYFVAYADYVLLWQEKWSLFLVSKNYLIEHLDQPGGFLVYIGRLFSAFYYHKVLGAILLALLALLAVRITSLTGSYLSGKTSYFLPFIIGAGMILLQSHYYYMAYNNLGIFFQLLFFYVASRFLKGWWEYLPVVLFPVWYFLFGGFAWIFLAMYSLFIISERKKLWWMKITASFSIALLVFYFSKEYLFYESIKTLLLFPFSLQNIGMQTAGFVVLIFLIAALPLLFRIKFDFWLNKSKKRFNPGQTLPFIIILVLMGLLVLRFDKKNKNFFHVQKLFYEQKYDEIIAFNSELQSTNYLVLFLNNLALAEKGQLTERLFQFPQEADGLGLFLKMEQTDHMLRLMPWFYYGIGMMNEAQRWAYEYMVMRGYTPEGLKMLIKTELMNRNYKIAEKYIEKLNQSIFYRKEARQFKQLLYNDKALNAHPELNGKMEIRPVIDFFVNSQKPALNVNYLVSGHSINRAVLEYYFAWLLLQKDVKRIVQGLPLLEEAGYKSIPRNIEEAVVSFKLLKKEQLPELKYLHIDREVEQQFNKFIRVLQQNGASEQQAQHALEDDFSDTYWFYELFH